MEKGNNNTASPIIFEQLYNAPIERVWKALTDKNEMKQWYFDLADFKAQVGFIFEFTGTGKEGEKYVHLCEVKEVIPQQKLAYSWRYDGLAGDSLVRFELFTEGEKTKLKLTHTGIESFNENGPSFTRESFTAGWNMITGTSLKAFVEK